MAAEDFAILVGISRYADPSYPTLDGPPHDVELMRKWLLDEKGGNLPKERIKTIVSPATFASDQDPLLAPPLPLEFETTFVRLERERMALKAARLSGRLYLFFSGHGFSSRDINRGDEAALYTANAAKDYYQHIFGTYFALRAKAKALFREIVLIMDCCRDAEANRAPTVPMMANTPDDDLAADVQLMAIYAVPRGGKAQERAIPERNGEIHGLLTHALIKAFEEARPTADGQISATRLRDHLKESWITIAGDEDGPPIPRVHLPTSEIHFAAKNTGVGVTFNFGQAPAAGTRIILRDGKLKEFAHLSADGSAGDLQIGDSPILGLARNGSSITLRMAPGFYAYELTGGARAKNTFKLETGDINVQL